MNDAKNDRTGKRGFSRQYPRGNVEPSGHLDENVLEQLVAEQTAQIRLQAEAIEHLAEGVMILEGEDWLQSRICFANAAMCRMTGYALNELIGRPRHILQADSADDSTVERVKRELSAGRSCSAEVMLRRKNGERYVTYISITPLHRESDRAPMFVSIHLDITVRKKAEKELERYRDELKTLASELMLAEEQERRRLAEDLHDSLGQALFRARMKIGELSPAPAANEAGVILEEVARIVSTMTFELSPPVLRTLGLRPALKSLAINMRQRYGLLVDYDDDEKDFKSSERTAMVLFRSARELLINVAKHAKTDRASLLLRRLKAEIQITVEDRGQGFDFATFSPVDSGRFGLLSIRERICGIGGVFQVRSAPGQGTCTTITAPLTNGPD